MIIETQPPESAFSRAVYKEIRPAIPRAQWPVEPLRATFVVAPDGLSMHATFEGLPPASCVIAAQVVARAKVDLVLASPVAYLAAAVVRIRRWRDTFLYALLPVLFAIPLLAALGNTAMRLSMVVSVITVLALIATNGSLLQARSKLSAARFVALIPTPGHRIKVPAGTPLHPQK